MLELWLPWERYPAGPLYACWLRGPAGPERPDRPSRPPLLLAPLFVTCLSWDVEADSEDSLLLRFWLWALLPAAATFSIKFKAIFE